MEYNTIHNADVKDKIVLVRVDYNVPTKDGKVINDFRIKSSLETINFLRQAGAKKIILISHLGRPEGGLTPENLKNFSLTPVFKHLQKLLPGELIGFYPLPTLQSFNPDFSNCRIALLENLRFDSGEESNSVEFAQRLIDYTGAEIFVQDGFAVTHRAHASTDAITKLLPSFAGLLLEKELTNLSQFFANLSKPFSIIIGGAKVADKAPLIEKFQNLADHIIIGGKIAADGFETNNPKVYVAEDFDVDSTGAKLDIGPVSAAKIIDLIKDSQTVVWNGLLGKAEDPAYSTSSTILAEYLGNNPFAKTLVCGGDTVGFVEELKQTHPDLNYTCISTGGGAAVEYISGKILPGLEALKKQ